MQSTFREMAFDLLFRGKCMLDQADKYLSVFNYIDIKNSLSFSLSLSLDIFT